MFPSLCRRRFVLLPINILGFMRFNTFFLFFFILLSSLFAVTAQAIGTPSRDSIPRIDYIGYRLYLTHFELIKEKKGYLYIKLSAINTGNKKMILGKGAAQVFPVAKFDESIGTAGLNDYQTEIYFKLLEEKVTVPIGGISTNIELKLLAESTESTDSAVDGEQTGNEPMVSEEQAVEESVEMVVVEKTPASVEVVEEEVVEEEPEIAEDACADLVLQNITILKRSKNAVTLEYELANRGAGRADLVRGLKKEQESIAIRAHLSSSQKLTRGAIVLESSFLHGDEISLNGGETYTGQIKLSLHKLTKFTPVLILELDAFEFVSECDEHNNLARVQLLENPE